MHMQELMVNIFFFLVVNADNFNDKAKSEKISDKRSVDR